MMFDWLRQLFVTRRGLIRFFYEHRCADIYCPRCGNECWSGDDPTEIRCNSGRICGYFIKKEDFYKAEIKKAAQFLRHGDSDDVREVTFVSLPHSDNDVRDRTKGLAERGVRVAGMKRESVDNVESRQRNDDKSQVGLTGDDA